MAGDKEAELIFRALAYQVAKKHRCFDSNLWWQTGCHCSDRGMAHSELLTTWIKERVDFLAPVLVYPGESEMEALAQGALRVLNQEETARKYV